MSIFNGHLRHDIREHNRTLDTACQRRGISLRTFKILSFGLRFLGVALAAYTLVGLGVEPTPTFWAFVAAMVLGPDVVEAYLANGETK